MDRESVLKLLRRDVTPELYGQIRNEWKTHSMAEDRRDIAGLLSTLTADCVYEIVQTEHVWRGHDGAKRFYTELLTAFPDIKFDLTSHRRAMGSLTFRWCRQRTTTVARASRTDTPACRKPVDASAATRLNRNADTRDRMRS